MNLARQIRPGEITFSGVNSTLPMLACLLAKRAYDFDFTYINVAGGVEPRPRTCRISSCDPAIAEGAPAIFANEDFYDLCARGRMDLVFLGRRKSMRGPHQRLGHRLVACAEGAAAGRRRRGGDAADGAARGRGAPSTRCGRW